MGDVACGSLSGIISFVSCAVSDCCFTAAPPCVLTAAACSLKLYAFACPVSHFTMFHFIRHWCPVRVHFHIDHIFGFFFFFN